MTSLYAPIMQQIQTTLAGVGAIKAIYAYPTEKVTHYPAAIYFPDTLENTFESNEDNLKHYRFKVYVVVGSAQKDQVDIFSDILPNAVDKVIEAFDAAWDGGTIDGHRVWCLINSGSWTIGQTPEGLEAQAELTLEFRAVTNT
ncbi:MAG: hypothetical protein E6Q97_32175 [Desulfurellales bacterium]|nr:MAG: hypothetical protein E6Q97_32175 [Desulfurellales bacterium]